MKTKHLRLLIALVAPAVACASARAGWMVHQKDEYSDEVRVWASPKESGLDFSWSGRVNARHEAEGYGTLEWLNKTKDQPVSVFIYTGDMKAGRREGTGVLLFRSGAKYSGEWRDNVKEGKGEYWYSNGDYYTGRFHNDLMDGPGRYVSADGTVFEGTFAADERNGPGFVIYPDGRRYASTWSADKDTNPAGAPVSAKPYMMLGIDVSQYKLNGKIFGGENATTPASYLTYRGRWMDGDLVIDPDWPYWVAWSQGGPVVADEDTTGDFEVGVYPVFLDIRIFNTAQDPLVIRKAETVVQESFPDLEPILRLQDGDESHHGGVTCEIVNFNASRVDECKVAFNILPGHAQPNFENYQFIETLAPFSERATFSLARAMKVLEINAEAIAAMATIDKPDPSRSEAEQRARREMVERRVRREMGRFPAFTEAGSPEEAAFSAYALIAGEVQITWTDHLGSQQAKRVKFQFRKCLCRLGSEQGTEGPPSGKYGVLLETEGKDYVVPFTYKRTIDPGATDRFTLQFASKVSTYQTFRIRLTTADGRKIISPRCRMHFLVPRNYSWKEGYMIEGQ